MLLGYNAATLAAVICVFPKDSSLDIPVALTVTDEEVTKKSGGTLTRNGISVPDQRRAVQKWAARHYVSSDAPFPSEIPLNLQAIGC